MDSLPCSPDLILHNATVYTVESDMPWAEAVAVRDRHIVAVGTNHVILSLAQPSTRLIDLHGKVMLPGLSDAHIHFHDWCLAQSELDLSETGSKKEMLQQIADHAGDLPSTAWLIGRGWNESRWGETAFPTASDIDLVTGSEQPAIFWRTDMHAAVVNHAALERAGVTTSTPDPDGGLFDRDGHGNPTGLLRELAIALIVAQLPQASPDRLLSALQQGMGLLHQYGITAIHDQRMKDGNDGPPMLNALNRLRRFQQLRLRVNFNLAAHQLSHLAGLGLSSGFGDNYLRLGHVKVFSDGSLGSKTAWMLEPFAQQDQAEPIRRGINLTPADQMAAEFRRAADLGFPISVHAIGDRANRLCLDSFEELLSSTQQPYIPHRIEHVQIISPEDLPRISELGLTASVQPLHLTDDMDTADRLVGNRGRHMYNFRSLLECGTLVAFGSDAPVADVNPFRGFHAAIYRQRPERSADPPWYGSERVSLEQTIFAYTLGAARAAGWQDSIGSVRPGKLADLIVLDRDIFSIVRSEVDSDQLASTTIDMTIFDGQIVYERQ